MTQSWEQYIMDEERKHTPSDEEMLKELDAYGHLNWTVGNEDWIACFDAIRYDDRIAYHVVVNCESAGFVDTIESGVIPVSDIDKLRSMPSYWADICSENYMDSTVRWKRVAKQWEKHLDRLAEP